MNATCPTGDTDGNCIFNTNDVSFCREYYTNMTNNPSDPILQLPSVQLSSLDADKNGKIDTNDVDYLLRVKFGNCLFVTGISVEPVSVGDTRCQLMITVNLTDGQSQSNDTFANPNTSFVYIDLESPNSALTSQLATSTVTTGSKTGIVKGNGYRGTLLRAQYIGSGQYGVSLGSDLILNNVGISLLLGTMDSNGVGSNARTTSLMGIYSLPPFEYSASLAMSVYVNANTTLSVVASSGYNSWRHFNSTVTSAVCNMAQACNGSSWQVTAATQLSPPVCQALKILSAEGFNI